MFLIQTIGLFFITAVAEIIGCYLPWLVLKYNKSPLLLIPAAFSLILFAWLLTLHPTASGRIYASYGGVYVIVALLWLKYVDRVSLTNFDLIGSIIIFLGLSIIVFQPQFK